MTKQELPKNTTKHKNMYVSICAVQTVCIATLLIAALVARFFFKGGFYRFKQWCGSNLLEETKTNAVFDEDGDT